MLIISVHMEKGENDMEWIPINQEYPRDNTKVLITRDIYGVSMIDIGIFTFNLHEFAPYDFNDEEYRREGFCEYDPEWGYWEISDVLAWMPLPEPWKGE